MMVAGQSDDEEPGFEMLDEVVGSSLGKSEHEKSSAARVSPKDSGVETVDKDQQPHAEGEERERHRSGRSKEPSGADLVQVVLESSESREADAADGRTRKSPRKNAGKRKEALVVDIGEIDDSDGSFAEEQEAEEEEGDDRSTHASASASNKRAPKKSKKVLTPVAKGRQKKSRETARERAIREKAESDQLAAEIGSVESEVDSSDEEREGDTAGLGTPPPIQEAEAPIPAASSPLRDTTNTLSSATNPATPSLNKVDATASTSASSSSSSSLHADRRGTERRTETPESLRRRFSGKPLKNLLGPSSVRRPVLSKRVTIPSLHVNRQPPPPTRTHIASKEDKKRAAKDEEEELDSEEEELRRKETPEQKMRRLIAKYDEEGLAPPAGWKSAEQLRAGGGGGGGGASEGVSSSAPGCLDLQEDDHDRASSPRNWDED